MCINALFHRSRFSGLSAGGCEVVRKISFAIIFVFISVIITVPLYAQDNDDYEMLKSYKLPTEAIMLQDTELIDGIRYYQDDMFTGITYELYANKQLMRVQSFKDGVLHGPTYVWYPAGQPQMAANYRNGRVNGRFRGWYMHGSILYDMVIGNRGYAGDYIEADGRGDSTADIDEEREGTDND